MTWRKVRGISHLSHGEIVLVTSDDDPHRICATTGTALDADWHTIIQSMTQIMSLKCNKTFFSYSPPHRPDICFSVWVESGGVLCVWGGDWIDVVWEMVGRLPQQCQEHYRLDHILAELTFVFLRVTTDLRRRRGSSDKEVPDPTAAMDWCHPGVEVADCLSWIDKSRGRDKTYIWVWVRWKTKN
jgi:hypothetical protein